MTGLTATRSPAQDLERIYVGLKIIGRDPQVGPDGLEFRATGEDIARKDVRQIADQLTDMILAHALPEGPTFLDVVNEQIGLLDEDPNLNPGRRYRAAAYLFNVFELGSALMEV